MSKHIFKHELHAGWKCYMGSFKVVGTPYRMDKARAAFHRNKNIKLFLRQEPNNEYDRHAIAVYVRKDVSVFFGKINFKRDYHIGYLPSDLAYVVDKHDLVGRTKIRIKTLYIYGSGDVMVIIDLIGPKSSYGEDLDEDMKLVDFDL